MKNHITILQMDEKHVILPSMDKKLITGIRTYDLHPKKKEVMLHE